jgi:DNA-directed RNA polymerase subunit L
MKIKFIEETSEKIKFKLLDTKYSIPEMLKKQLLTYKGVVMASGMLEHPEDDESIFVLVVEKGLKPREILLKAIDELQKELLTFKDQMVKELKEAK